MPCVNKSLLALLILVSLTGCAPPATPAPAPVAAYLGTTPAYAELLDRWVQSYWEQEPGNGVTPQIYPLEAAWQALQEYEIELLVTAAPPPVGWFATPLQRDAIAILVHPDLDIKELDLDQLYGIFSGRVENWNELAGFDHIIQPIIPLQGDEIRTTFQTQVLQGANYSSNAQLAPHPRAALEIVGREPGAIALIPWTAVPTGRSALRVAGVGPSATTIENGSYLLTLNLIATAPEEPIGAMRQFLGWLQASLLSEP
jgi:hypothetical protein